MAKLIRELKVSHNARMAHWGPAILAVAIALIIYNQG